jgi:hypothetical protein
MKTVLRILDKAGGYRRDLNLRIENPPYMTLVIEATPGPGPLGVRRHPGREAEGQGRGATA